MLNKKTLINNKNTKKSENKGLTPTVDMIQYTDIMINNTNKKENTMITAQHYNKLREQEDKIKKFYSNVSVGFGVVGLLAMVSAVGAIEADHYLFAASVASLGIFSFVTTLYTQELSKIQPIVIEVVEKEVK